MTLKHCLILLVLIVLPLFIYGQALDFGFVNYDDDVYVYNNPHLQRGITRESLAWAWTADLTHDSRNADYWQPLTLMSRLLDAELFGMSPRGHHLTNLVIHIANVVLLFLIFSRLTRRTGPSALMAALFAVHPIHVESVAWITERKDVLSCFFGLCAIAAYARFCSIRTSSAYFLAVGMHLAAVMSKPMMVTVPLVLLVLSFWPLGSVIRSGDARRTVIRTLVLLVPFFLLSLLSAYVTMKVPQPALSIGDVTFSYRIQLAIRAFYTYLPKLLIPDGLACFYPVPNSIAFSETVIQAGCLLLISTATLFFRTKAPYFLAGWWWYILALAPMTINTHLAGVDHYAYWPFIGLYMVVAWSLDHLVSRCRVPNGLTLVMTILILAPLTFLSWKQTAYWQDSVTLFNRAISVTKDNHLAHRNLGIAYLEADEVDSALEHLMNSIRIKPNYASGHFNLAIALETAGRSEEALAHYSAASYASPRYEGAHYNRAMLLDKLGRLEEAMDEYRAEAALFPEDPSTQNNLAGLLLRRGDHADAARHFEAALALAPRQPVYHAGLAAALIRLSRAEEAVEHLVIALRLDPDNPMVIMNAQGVATLILTFAMERGEETGAWQWLEERFGSARAWPQIRQALTKALESHGKDVRDPGIDSIPSPLPASDPARFSSGTASSAP